MAMAMVVPPLGIWRPWVSFPLTVAAVAASVAASVAALAVVLADGALDDLLARGYYGLGLLLLA